MKIYSRQYFFDQVKDLVKAHKLTIVETITSTKVNPTLIFLPWLMKPTTVGRRAEQEVGSKKGAGWRADICFHPGRAKYLMCLSTNDKKVSLSTEANNLTHLYIRCVSGEHFRGSKQEWFGAKGGFGCSRVH